MVTSPSDQRGSRPSSLGSILSRRGLIIFRVLVAVVIVGGACAWLASARVGAQGQPVFRARAELVRLDVSITDSEGRPVPDVRPEEIEVTENGRPRPVVLFRHLSVSGDDERAQAAAFQEVSANGGGSFGHLYVLVFDQAHIGVGREHWVQQAAERFLTRSVKPGDAVAIYALPGPGPVLSFTSDIGKARARLAEVRGRAGRRAANGLSEYDAYQSVRTGGQSEDLDLGRRSDSIYADMPSAETRKATASQVVGAADTETHVFLQNLAEIMRGLRTIDGRKAFVLFSEGFMADNLGPQLEHVASAAAQSQSVVYGIDLNRVATGTASEIAERREPLARLAAETNGAVFSGSTSLDDALGRVASQANDYYLVGIEPAATETPHDYHRVKVNVTRRGLVAHTRTGYSTLPSVAPISDRQAIDVALAVPRTSSALPIAYTTYERSGPTADKPRVIASITAHVPRLTAVERTADVVFIVRDVASGQAVASGTEQVHVEPGRGDAAGALDPVRYSVQFDVPPGDYWMRVLVREPGGVIGTADRRLHVWPLSGPGVTTSDLIVTRLDGQRFDAPTEADVARGDQVLAYLEMYGDAGSVAAKVEVVNTASDEVVATAEPLVKPGSHGERILRARLPIDALAAGFYAARVRLTSPNQALRTIVRNFRVIAPGGSDRK